MSAVSDSEETDKYFSKEGVVDINTELPLFAGILIGAHCSAHFGRPPLSGTSCK